MGNNVKQFQIMNNLCLEKKKRNERNSKDNNASNIVYGVSHMDFQPGEGSKVRRHR